MARLVVRSLRDEIVARLSAVRRGRSTEAEVREILRKRRQGTTAPPRKPLGSGLRARFTGTGLDGELPQLRRSRMATRFEK